MPMAPGISCRLATWRRAGTATAGLGVLLDCRRRDTKPGPSPRGHLRQRCHWGAAASRVSISALADSADWTSQEWGAGGKYATSSSKAQSLTGEKAA